MVTAANVLSVLSTAVISWFQHAQLYVLGGVDQSCMLFGLGMRSVSTVHAVCMGHGNETSVVFGLHGNEVNQYNPLRKISTQLRRRSYNYSSVTSTQFVNHNIFLAVLQQS